jgi:F0F1-type ATP synthase delta subunit
MYPCRNVHKYTGNSPDGKIQNTLDHVLTGGESIKIQNTLDRVLTGGESIKIQNTLDHVLTGGESIKIKNTLDHVLVGGGSIDIQNTLDHVLIGGGSIKIQNTLDHVLIVGGSIKTNFIRSFKEAVCSTDQILLVENVRERISARKRAAHKFVIYRLELKTARDVGDGEEDLAKISKHFLLLEPYFISGTSTGTGRML